MDEQKFSMTHFDIDKAAESLFFIFTSKVIAEEAVNCWGGRLPTVDDIKTEIIRLTNILVKSDDCPMIISKGIVVEKVEDRLIYRPQPCIEHDFMSDFHRFLVETGRIDDVLIPEENEPWITIN